MNVALDTNAYSDFMRGDPARSLRLFKLSKGSQDQARSMSRKHRAQQRVPEQ